MKLTLRHLAAIHCPFSAQEQPYWSFTLGPYNTAPVVRPSAVSALGVSKEQREVGDDTPGLRAVVGGLLRILPEPGSKPLHDELKNLMQVHSVVALLSSTLQPTLTDRKPR